MKMTLHLFKYECSGCGRVYRAPVILQSAYGEFLLRSGGRGTEAYLDAKQDPIYREVSDSVKHHPLAAQLRAIKQGELVQKVFGITCDPDTDGSDFQTWRKPKCPYCGVDKPSRWEATEPPELIEMDLPPITHNQWVKRGASERGALLEWALRQELEPQGEQ